MDEHIDLRTLLAIRKAAAAFVLRSREMTYDEIAEIVGAGDRGAARKAYMRGLKAQITYATISAFHELDTGDIEVLARGEDQW